MLASETGFSPHDIESMSWRERERWAARLAAYNEEIEEQAEKQRDLERGDRAPTPEEIAEYEAERDRRNADSAEETAGVEPAESGDGDAIGERVPLSEIRRQFGDGTKDADTEE